MRPIPSLTKTDTLTTAALAEASEPASSSQAVDASASTPSAKLPSPTLGYLSFGPDEAGLVKAMVNVMCPADAFTQSGVDCGLAVYIDRQLAGSFGKGARLYMRGPWHEGKPQFRYQSPLTPEQFFQGRACRRRCLGQDAWAVVDARLRVRGIEGLLTPPSCRTSPAETRTPDPSACAPRDRDAGRGSEAELRAVVQRRRRPRFAAERETETGRSFI